MYQILGLAFLIPLTVAFTDYGLVNVHILFRHGARSPIALLPCVKNASSYWPMGLGWLTNVGIEGEYLLGCWMRQRYGNTFVGENYDRKELNLVSTPKARTMMSAEAYLAGFYRQASTPLSKYQLPWSPIPVFTIPHVSTELVWRVHA